MSEYLDKWDGDIIRALRFQDEEICELAADEIERLRAALSLIDDQLSQAAQDDCEHGVSWLNEQRAKQYLAHYPHTSAAISYAHKTARAALGGDA